MEVINLSLSLSLPKTTSSFIFLSLHRFIFDVESINTVMYSLVESINTVMYSLFLSLSLSLSLSIYIYIYIDLEDTESFSFHILRQSNFLP